MCCCEKPTINGRPGYSWDGIRTGIRPLQAPATEDGETILYDEPGRCGGLDSHERHYLLVRERFGGVSLRVRHGAGEESLRFTAADRTLLPALSSLDSTARYWVFNAISHAHRDGRREASEEIETKWRTAAAEKRIKTRKSTRGGYRSTKVWIEAQA